MIRDELIDAVYVVDHKEGGDRASSDIDTGVVSASVGAVFSVRIFLYKANGSHIAVNGLQIDGGHIGKNVFRAIRAVAVVGNDDGAFVGDCVNGIFEVITLAEECVIKDEAAEEDEE